MSDIVVFKLGGKVLPEGTKVNAWTAAQLEGESIEVYDRETRKCMLYGTVSDVCVYGGLTVLAVWDCEEPLAWALVLNADGSITYHNKVYDVAVVDAEEWCV